MSRATALIAAALLVVLIGCGKSETGQEQKGKGARRQGSGSTGAGKTGQEEKRCVKFGSYGMQFTVPDKWQVIDARGIKTGLFTQPTERHADQYVKGKSGLCCFLQLQDSGTVRPTICLVPGEDFIKGTPENGNLRGGTGLVAGVLASQLAWLAVSENSLPKVSGNVSMSMQTFAGHEELGSEIAGDSVRLIGVAIKVGSKATRLTIGFATPPDKLNEVKEVAEAIIRQIEANIK